MSHGIKWNDMWTKRENEADKLRMAGGAWTVNLDEMPKEGINNIRYVTDTYLYDIPLADALSHGFERQFAGETKLVVPLKFWKISERNKDGR